MIRALRELGKHTQSPTRSERELGIGINELAERYLIGYREAAHCHYYLHLMHKQGHTLEGMLRAAEAKFDGGLTIVDAVDALAERMLKGQDG